MNDNKKQQEIFETLDEMYKTAVAIFSNTGMIASVFEISDQDARQVMVAWGRDRFPDHTYAPVKIASNGMFKVAHGQNTKLRRFVPFS